MAGEKAAGNPPANAGGGNANSSNANKGPNRNNRRRSVRSKRRGHKPEEGSEPREAPENRAVRPPTPGAPKVAEKNLRDNRERRRRRRMRTKQRGPGENTTPVVEDALKDLPPLVPSFVYTHVIRPAVRDSFEFRSEHFSKVTRKLEDFHIDLSPLYPDGGDEIKGVAYMPPDTDRSIFDDDEETIDDPEWDAAQSAEAALLEGVIADDFYAELDDSVLDDSPQEDIDQ